MSFIKIPSKGMRDILPQEMFLREYVLNIMKETYKKFGFKQVGMRSKYYGEADALLYTLLIS